MPAPAMRSLSAWQYLDAVAGVPLAAPVVEIVRVDCERPCCRDLHDEATDLPWLILCAAVALILLALFCLSVVWS